MSHHTHAWITRPYGLMICQSIDMLSRANALRREYRLGNTASRNGAGIDTTSRHHVVISRSRQSSHQYYCLFGVTKSQPVPVPGYRAAILWLPSPRSGGAGVRSAYPASWNSSAFLKVELPCSVQSPTQPAPPIALSVKLCT